MRERERKDHEKEHLIPVEIVGIHPGSNLLAPHTFAVLLKGAEDKVVPIVIGAYEGEALLRAKSEEMPPRPMSHDLMHTLLARIKAEVHQVVVHSLKEEVFHAYMLVQTQEEVFYQDCRASDGMILATLMEVPIYVTPEVMAEAGCPLEELFAASGPREKTEEGNAEPELEVERESAPKWTAAKSGKPGGENLSEIEKLQAELDRLVAEEAYEQAAELRDQISRMKKNS